MIFYIEIAGGPFGMTAIVELRKAKNKAKGVLAPLASVV
jgi:hypothetical protein